MALFDPGRVLEGTNPLEGWSPGLGGVTIGRGGGVVLGELVAPGRVLGGISPLDGNKEGVGWGLPLTKGTGAAGIRAPDFFFSPAVFPDSGWTSTGITPRVLPGLTVDALGAVC